jgi:hypothetical protein
MLSGEVVPWAQVEDTKKIYQNQSLALSLFAPTSTMEFFLSGLNYIKAFQTETNQISLSQKKY